MMIIPSVNIYFNKSKRIYLVQELMQSPLGGSVECGEPTAVDENEFDSRIAHLVFGGLTNYENRDYSEESERRFESSGQSVRFAREHLAVNVAKLGDRIRVSALQRRGSGHIGGIPGGEVVVDRDSAVRNLHHLLRNAFEKAV